jgi:hypothetical protein
MTIDLGDFGADHDPVEYSFQYFGDTIRVHPELTDLAIVDLFGRVGGRTLAESMQAINRIGELFIHPEDVDRFWSSARAHRQTQEDVIGLALALVGAMSERPTLQPSDSSDGLRRTDTSSTGDSFSRAIEILDDRGRPDLAVAVQRRAREAASAS